MDTSQFEEIFHPLDKDMRDTLEKDDQLLFHLMNTNLSLEELSIAGEALTKRIYDEEYRFSVIPVKQCDPNILGIVSDFVIQVEEINTCVAFNPNPGGYKLSVRSCVKEAKANEMAQFLCADIGNGGGHLTKGLGWDKAEIDSRIIKIMPKDVRFYITEYIRDKKTLDPQCRNDWKVVPKRWFKKGKEKDYQLLYEQH